MEPSWVPRGYELSVALSLMQLSCGHLGLVLHNVHDFLYRWSLTHIQQQLRIHRTVVPIPHVEQEELLVHHAWA